MRNLFAKLICVILLVTLVLSGCSEKNKGNVAADATDVPKATETANPSADASEIPAEETVIPSDDVPTAEASTQTPKGCYTPTAEIQTTETPSASDATPLMTQTVPAPTPTVLANVTPESTTEEKVYFAAYEGYYDATERTSVVKRTAYLNLFNTRTYYTYPDTEAWIKVPGKVADWSIYSDKFNLVSSLSVIDGKLILKTVPADLVINAVTNEVSNVKSGTGYIYLQSKANGEKVKVYVNLKAPKSESRKQTNPALKYYLYFEKGDYKKFVSGTCCLTVFRVDNDGYYTIPYFTFSSACGDTKALTPTGVHTLGSNKVGSYETSDKRELKHYWNGGTSQYSQYAITYEDDRFLHGPCTYPDRGPDGIMKDNYDGVGGHVSGGCLRMQTGAIYWIWSNCPDGTSLEIRDLNPLGTKIERPAGMKVSIGYDPTDPILVNYFK